MDALFTTENLIALVTLTGLEIVLGIDNVIFIAILAGKLPGEQQAKARQVGLALAMITRIMLLRALGWMMGLTADLFTIPEFWTGHFDKAHGFSGRDLILLVGGLFLIGKATYEIHDKLEGEHEHTETRAYSAFSAVIVQIVLIDIVFSLDSVITAVGMVRVEEGKQWVGLSIMISAVIIAVGVMLVFAGKIASFVERHPTMKMLALSFLLLIGVTLFADGLGLHIPKGYVYFAMAFSLTTEILNMRLRRINAPVALKQSYVEASPAEAAEAKAS